MVRRSDGGKGWLNSPGSLNLDLHGKVVLYDFWTYRVVNCLRTLPYVRTLYDRYHGDGLEVIRHPLPEFDFEKQHGNVTQACTISG